MKILPTGIAVIEGDTHASKWIEEQGRLDYDGAVQRDIVPLLKAGDTVLDVGAMFGAYASVIKRAVGPTGRVIAFEPNPIAFECLQHNCPDVFCLNMALGNHDGYCSIHKSVKYPDNLGASYVGESTAGRIKMTSLDSFWKDCRTPIHLIKLDVEGLEPDFIEGAIYTLETLRPILFVEINHDVLRNRGHTYEDVIIPLRSMGYTPRFLENGHSFVEKDWSQLDLLMMP